jgi:hypothetical protein
MGTVLYVPALLKIPGPVYVTGRGHSFGTICN